MYHYFVTCFNRLCIGDNANAVGKIGAGADGTQECCTYKADGKFKKHISPIRLGGLYRSMTKENPSLAFFYQVWEQVDTIVYKFPALNLEQCVLNGQVPLSKTQIDFAVTQVALPRKKMQLPLRTLPLFAVSGVLEF